MMSRHFRQRSEFSGNIAEGDAKNQVSAPGSFLNQLLTDIYIRISLLLKLD